MSASKHKDIHDHSITPNSKIGEWCSRLGAGWGRFAEAFELGGSRIEGGDAAILNLYGMYSKKIELEEIWPEYVYQNHSIFLSFRAQFCGELTSTQEGCLAKMLESASARWFVPHVLNVTNYFSLELLGQLIDTALQMEDALHMQRFLEPAIRVFDLKIDLELQERFPNASLSKKMAILSIYDWLSSREVTVKRSDRTLDNYAVRYTWSGSRFCRGARMSDEDYLAYCHSMRFVQHQRLTVLLHAYFRSTDRDLHEAISRLLLQKIQEYPPDLHNQASAYLGIVE